MIMSKINGVCADIQYYVRYVWNKWYTYQILPKFDENKSSYYLDTKQSLGYTSFN